MKKKRISIVISRTLEKVEWGKWNNARLVKNNIAEEITKLKQQPGKDMVIYVFSADKILQERGRLAVLFTVKKVKQAANQFGHYISPIV